MAERLMAERLMAERLMAERLMAERLMAERLMAERLMAERLMAERRDGQTSIHGGSQLMTTSCCSRLAALCYATGTEPQQTRRLLP